MNNTVTGPISKAQLVYYNVFINCKFSSGKKQKHAGG